MAEQVKLTLKARFYYGVGCFVFVLAAGFIGFLIKFIPRNISIDTWNIEEYWVVVLTLSLVVGVVGAIKGPKIFSS